METQEPFGAEKPVRKPQGGHPSDVRFVLPLAAMGVHVVMIRYRTWRRTIEDRRVIPMRVEFSAPRWHPFPGWRLRAFDLDCREERGFLLDSILAVGWTPEELHDGE